MAQSGYYKVGTIVNTQGLQGEVRVISVTDFAEDRYRSGSHLALFDDKDQFIKEVVVKTHRKHKQFHVLKFVDHYHINQVEGLKNKVLKVAAEQRGQLDDHEFYYSDIIGLAVYEADRLIGHVKEILQPGANDVWVVSRKGQKDLLLPYIPSVVLSVDLTQQRVNVELLEGLD